MSKISLGCHSCGRGYYLFFFLVAVTDAAKCLQVAGQHLTTVTFWPEMSIMPMERKPDYKVFMILLTN